MSDSSDRKLKTKSILANNSEKTLFLKLKKHKDRQAFIEVYDLYLEPIYRFVYFKVGDKAQAEDLTSQVFLKCWSCIQDGKITDYQTIRAFLYKVARNTVIDYYRQNRVELSLDDENALDVEDRSQGQVDKLDIELTMDMVKEQLLQLKDEYREALILKFINELSISEIADILGKTKGNVRVLLHRATEALKNLVTKQEKHE